MPKIAFVGASGCGKTTLAKHLHQVYKLLLNPGGSRATAAALGFTNPYDVDIACATTYAKVLQLGGSPETAARHAIEHGRQYSEDPSCRALFQAKLQADKIQWELENDSFVTDRTTLDDLAYSVLHCREAVTQEFYERALSHMSTYDVVFFTPMSAFQNLAQDPARVSDPMYHRIFETLIVGLLEESCLNSFFKITAQDLLDRTDFVERRVDSISKSRR